MRHLIILAALGLVTGCASTVSRPLPEASLATVDAPTFMVGDEWRRNDGAFIYTEKVVGFEDTFVITQRTPNPLCESCRYYRDVNGTIVKVADATGGYRPGDMGWKFLDFPLRVGKEWSFRLSGVSGSGAVAEYLNQFKVETYEEVTVKAGVFKAFRIQHYQKSLSANNTFSGYATYWFAPEAKTIIKRVAKTTGSGRSWGRDWELESFKLVSPSDTPARTTVQAAAAVPPVSPAPPAPRADEVLTNEAVVAMVKAGLGEKLVLAKIKASPGRFDVRTDALIRLRAAGVSDRIIEAMMAKSAAP
jgi:hypothetical protein